MPRRPRSPFFFFNDTATTEIYTLSLHDALPIWGATWWRSALPSRSRPSFITTAHSAGRPGAVSGAGPRSEEHTSELQSQSNLVCRLLLEKKKKNSISLTRTSQKYASTHVIAEHP